MQNRKIVVYPHKLYRDRYVAEFRIVSPIHTCDNFTLTSLSLNGLLNLWSFLKHQDRSSLLEIHTSMGALFPLLLGALLGFRRRRYVCHGTLAMSKRWHHRCIGALLESANNILSTEIICVNKEMEKMFRKKNIKSLTPPGIFDYHNIEYYRDQMKGLSGRINIGFVGRAVDRKGIKIFAEYAKQFTFDNELEFHLFGSDITLHNVTSHGFVKNKTDIYNKIDILYVCSDFEGFCDAAAEAMMAGCYVLHRDVPGLGWLPASSNVYNSLLAPEYLRRLTADLKEDFDLLRIIYNRPSIHEIKRCEFND